MRYFLTLVRMAIIKKSTNNKYWRGCGEKGPLLHCWWECRQQYGSSLKTKCPYDLAMPLLGIYLEKKFEMIHAPQCSMQDYLL